MAPPPETQVITDSDTFDGLDVTMDTTLPVYATDSFEFSTDITTNGLAPDVNVALVIDSSGSTGGLSGSDVDGDGIEDTFFEAQIFAAREMFRNLIEAGYDPETVEVTLVDYDSGATNLGTFNLNQLAEFEAALATMTVGGATSYENGLAEVLNEWNGDPTVGDDDSNLVLFLSDGYPYPSSQNFSDEVQELEEDFNAQITAIGVGANSSLAALNQVDNTGTATQVTDASQLADVINAPPPLPELTEVQVYVDGVLVETYVPGDPELVETPFGYRISDAAIQGYAYTIGEEIEVEVKSVFGDSGNVLTTGVVTIPMVICFAAGTRILTPNGSVPVEGLAEGDRVVTRDHGVQVIRWIGATELSAAYLQANPELKPIRFAKGSLGENLPERDLQLSRQHRVLARDWQAELVFGAGDGVLIPAFSLLNDSTIRVHERPDGVIYYHIAFAQHEVVYAEGVEAESFHPSKQTVAALSPAQRGELFALFPQLEHLTDDDAAVTSARTQLKGSEGRVYTPGRSR